MINKVYKKVLTGAAILLAVAAGAQDNTAAAAPVAAPVSPDNTVMYLLVAACAILLVAILLLSNVFVKLTAMALDKRAAKTTAVILLMLGANTLFAQDVAAKPFQLPVRFDLLVGTLVIVLQMIVLLFMLKRISSLLSEISGETEQPKAITIQLPRLFDNINASVAIEKEQDILLDHDYDGIRELDNSLPPWWKYSFYVSIVWSFFYLGYYFIGGGQGSIDEYKAEVQLAKIEVEEYNRKNADNVDENNVKLADAAGVLDGQDIFKTNCAACHGAGGEGGVGPNLTDSYWLHGGSPGEVFKSVKYGWPAKGMKSWQSDLSPSQIRNVISYIHTIHGSNPANAKAPQGDLYAEGGAVTAADSTKATDSTTTATGEAAK